MHNIIYGVGVVALGAVGLAALFWVVSFVWERFEHGKRPFK
jgi:hypothetical protein